MFRIKEIESDCPVEERSKNCRAKALAKKRTAQDIADSMNQRLGGGTSPAYSPFKAEGYPFHKKAKVVKAAPAKKTLET